MNSEKTAEAETRAKKEAIRKEAQQLLASPIPITLTDARDYERYHFIIGEIIGDDYYKAEVEQLFKEGSPLIFSPEVITCFVSHVGECQPTENAGLLRDYFKKKLNTLPQNPIEKKYALEEHLYDLRLVHELAKADIFNPLIEDILAASRGIVSTEFPLRPLLQNAITHQANKNLKTFFNYFTQETPVALWEALRTELAPDSDRAQPVFYLHQATQRHSWPCVQILLEYGGLNACATNSRNESPLQRAIDTFFCRRPFLPVKRTVAILCAFGAQPYINTDSQPPYLAPDASDEERRAHVQNHEYLVRIMKHGDFSAYHFARKLIRNEKRIKDKTWFKFVPPELLSNLEEFTLEMFKRIPPAILLEDTPPVPAYPPRRPQPPHGLFKKLLGCIATE